MDFSVVIPSRNRPSLVRDAIGSVLAQSHAALEIVVVNDGSNEECDASYRHLEVEFGERVRVLHLQPTQRGHGPSFAINRGVEAARGSFVCFLDDDDTWTDPEHLARAWRVIGAAPRAGDLYFANQRAYVSGVPLERALWLESLTSEFVNANATDAADSNGVHRVGVADLVRHPGFSHLNTTIVRTSLYRSIGGMDEGIRYECEFDLYLRMIASADGIHYYPGIVSRHNVPDPTRAQNVSTTFSYLEKMASRCRVMDKAILFNPSPEVRWHALKIRSLTLKDATAALVAAGRYDAASAYAWSALPGSRKSTWLLYCFYCDVRRFLGRIGICKASSEGSSPAPIADMTTRH